ncbi:MAG TPA: inositol monophosphatase family protein [Bacteroidia bacterium]|nr:inositol monophosphatase family protein [Bacteroidia bacterium]
MVETLSVDLKKLCLEVSLLSKSVAVFINGERDRFSEKDIEKKGHNDLVSYVDKEAERLLVQGLSSILPGSGFITEEKTRAEQREQFTWIIDPLDGTTNFIHGVPCYCISIALLASDKLVLGLVHELTRDECFYAWDKGGAYLNGEKINVSSVNKLSDSLLATGFPYHNYDRMKPYMEVFDHCMRFTHGLRRLGSAAADLAYVACGRFESFYEYGLNPWDVAGGAILVLEAGGQVSDFKGGSDYIFGEEIIASNAHVAAEMLGVVKEKFEKYSREENYFDDNP